MEFLDIRRSTEVYTVTALGGGLIHLNDCTTVPDEFIGIECSTPLIDKTLGIPCDFTSDEMYLVERLTLSCSSVLELERESITFLCSIEFQRLENEACSIRHCIKHMELAFDHRLSTFHALLSDEFDSGINLCGSYRIWRALHGKRVLTSIFESLSKSGSSRNLSVAISVGTGPDTEISTVGRLEVNRHHVVCEGFEACHSSLGILDLCLCEYSRSYFLASEHTPLHRVNLTGSSFCIPRHGY